MRAATRIPVIVGVGEVIDRPATLSVASEPLALMEAALRDASVDAGAWPLEEIDSLDVVNLISWPYEAPADQLAARLEIAPAHRRYGSVGGETPIKFIHEAAARIARGESEVAAICGGEAHLSVARAAAQKVQLPWTEKPVIAAPSVRGQDTAHPLAKAIGAHLPVTVYPFYEVATAAEQGVSPSSALSESSELWSAMSKVAAANPNAWFDRAVSAQEIESVTADNRMIAWPYRKLMVANIAVNMGAAVIVTSLARARAAGIDERRLIYVHGGYSAEEPSDYLMRDGYARCLSRDTVLQTTAARTPGGFDHVELYSCFPCVPKAARRVLNLDAHHPCTVTGGLTFAGAPLNNYMSHATAAMVRKLRGEPGTGLLYGQGGFMTKHATLVLATSPPAVDWICEEPSLTAQCTGSYGPVPRFNDRPSGPGKVETYTVIHSRDGDRGGIVIARLDTTGERSLGLVAPDQIERLEDSATFAVGQPGHFHTPNDGIPIWRFT